MKKQLLPFLLLFITYQAFAQNPQIPYQAVARDASGNLLQNQTVSLRFTIHSGSAGGSNVFQEIGSATTNLFGLFTYNIGTNTNLSGVNWSNASMFMQVEMDPTGGTNYTNMGTNQMLSVPYALYAVTSGNGVGPAGATGPSGANGTNGSNGSNGTAGTTGPTGANGPAGATGPSGANGTNGSNGSNGTAGATGPTGANGPAGATGPTGANGTNGSNGSNGTAGATGPTGANGPAGATGPTGANGTNGSNGSNGTAGTTGPTGANGPAGATGPTGANGTNGSNGSNGTAGTTGPTGANGPAGATGPSGANGTNGSNGSNGTAGATGPTGANGPAGATGPTGANGTNGSNGSNGTAGTTGPTGANGPAGATGPSGANGTNGSNGSNGTAGTTGPTGPNGATGTNGTAGATGATGPGGVSGTLNYLAKFSAASTVGNSQIIDNGTNVGIGTISAPTSKLELNGTLKFTLDGSTVSKAPRQVSFPDTRTGCPATAAANTNLYGGTITLTNSATVFVSAFGSSEYSGRSDFLLLIDGTTEIDGIAYTPTQQWQSMTTQWSGTLSSGSHTVYLQSSQANAIGCGATFGRIDVIIFEQ